MSNTDKESTHANTLSRRALGLGGNMANAVSGSAPVLCWTSGAPRYRFADCYNIANQSNF